MKNYRGMQIYDLTNDKECKKYFSALKHIIHERAKVPVMAKGTMRMIDFTKKVSKMDFYPPFETAWTKQEKLILGNFFSGQ
jgi:hypothetical protein